MFDRLRSGMDEMQLLRFQWFKVVGPGVDMAGLKQFFLSAGEQKKAGQHDHQRPGGGQEPAIRSGR